MREGREGGDKGKENGRQGGEGEKDKGRRERERRVESKAVKGKKIWKIEKGGDGRCELKYMEDGRRSGRRDGEWREGGNLERRNLRREQKPGTHETLSEININKMI